MRLAYASIDIDLPTLLFLRGDYSTYIVLEAILFNSYIINAFELRPNGMAGWACSDCIDYSMLLLSIYLMTLTC